MLIIAAALLLTFATSQISTYWLGEALSPSEVATNTNKEPLCCDRPGPTTSLGTPFPVTIKTTGGFAGPQTYQFWPGIVGNVIVYTGIVSIGAWIVARFHRKRTSQEGKKTKDKNS